MIRGASTAAAVCQSQIAGAWLRVFLGSRVGFIVDQVGTAPCSVLQGSFIYVGLLLSSLVWPAAAAVSFVALVE